MSGWADDCESAVNLAVDAVKELQELDSKNTLLWWWIKPTDGVPDPFTDEADRLQRFKDRYWDKEEPWEKEAGVIVVTVVTSNYYFDVKAEIERLKLQASS